MTQHKILVSHPKNTAPVAVKKFVQAVNNIIYGKDRIQYF